MEITPPFQDEPRKESPGEEAERLGALISMLASHIGMAPTPTEKAALASVAKMVMRWIRKLRDDAVDG